MPGADVRARRSTPTTARGAAGGDLDRIEREDDAFRGVVADGYRELARPLPGARRRCSTARSPPSEIAEQVREQVRAALASSTRRSACSTRRSPKGPAHAYLFHGPARRRQARARARVRARAARHDAHGASRSLRARRARRDDPDRRDPRAPPRPAHAPVRGRPARVPRPQRAPDERGRRRRAAQGSRGAAAVRGDRARRGRPRADPGDDPLALPARAVHGGSRSARSASVVDARAPELDEERRIALARVAGGRLDRLERLLDPTRPRAGASAARAGARGLPRAGVRAGRRRGGAARGRARARRGGEASSRR